MCGQIGTEPASREQRQDAYFEDVTRAGLLDGDWPGQDVRAWAAVIHLLPQGRDLLVHQKVRGIARVVGDRLHGHRCARAHRQRRLDVAVEVTPVHG